MIFEREILARADVRENLLTQGVDPVTGSPADLAALTKAELVRWARVVEASGAKVD